MRGLGILMRGLGILMMGSARPRTANTSRLRLLLQDPSSLAKKVFGKQVSLAHVIADQCTAIHPNERFTLLTCPAGVAGGITLALLALVLALFVWYTRARR